MLYIYKVFEHLKHLWMGIWRHIHSVITTEVSPDLGEFAEILDDVNSLTAIRVLAGTKNSRPVGFYSRKSPTQQSHKYDHRGGAVRPSYGVGSMDPPDRTRVTSSELKQII